MILRYLRDTNVTKKRNLIGRLQST